MGAYVAMAGIALFTVAVFLDWLSVDVADAAGDDRYDGGGGPARRRC